MDVVKISLEALLQRATNPQNENIDSAAMEAFCALVNKEKDGPLLGVRLLAARMHSKRELEALQTLHILDCAMHKCGVPLQDEVGKFRFLNEMIKLVSPKYLGAHTPPAVKQKVLQLMYLWMLDYPKQSKIKDAYEMLRKQGVIKEAPLSVSADYQQQLVAARDAATIFHDEEKGKLLRKLLQSKNPEDLQAANRLIKTMVREDERKAELQSRRVGELEAVQNNARLLAEMLDSYRAGVSSADDTELIRELHASCVRMRPSVTALAADVQQQHHHNHGDELLADVLRVGDELTQVCETFHAVMVLGRETSAPAALLDLCSLDNCSKTTQSQSNVDVLCDILSSPVGAANDILKPVTVVNADVKVDDAQANKQRGFESLDALGESLLLENLQSKTRLGAQFQKASADKTPMNLLTGNKASQTAAGVNGATLTTSANPLVTKTPCLNLDAELSRLVGGDAVLDVCTNGGTSSTLDDLLVDITITPTPTPTMTPTLSRTISASSTSSSAALERRVESHEGNERVTEETIPKNLAPLKLSELFVDLESIKPSGVEPIVALNEQNGVSLTLHFAKDKPHEDVNVIVVSIVNKNEMPMKGVLFRAIVPKVCKVKLQPPSANDLPACNPFLPPSAITQVLLIANPEKVRVSLKFIVSYSMDDETMTEMGEIEALPT